MANSSAPEPVKNYEEFKATVVPMLLTLGPYIHSDSILMYKILRVLKAALKIVSTILFVNR